MTKRSSSRVILYGLVVVTTYNGSHNLDQIIMDFMLFILLFRGGEEQ